MLLNPHQHNRHYPDEISAEIMRKTIEFFENKGRRRIKEDDHERVWYADFIEFAGREQLFAKLMTPGRYANGREGVRWDSWRNCEFNEILGFYGLAYWYTWQVSMLGLGPIWISDNEAVKKKTVQLLRDGHVFAFGLSEQEHGADIYSSEMKLVPQDDGSYLARGRKYYIGNANAAGLVSTFGKIDGTDDYVFFVVDPRHEKYECVQNVCNSQNYVAEFALHNYPITEADILSRGQEAWDASLNTINFCKYNLGWASIGISTHAFYEAIDHAAGRHLFNSQVTDFPHVRQLFVDGYARLVAMKLFALRASDYMRAASPDDRRYLLYNPMVKMKVTTQGEDVIDHLWDVIAAKGFERNMYFEMAARDIRALPKLEGTVHVNMALIIKFMANYFFKPGEFPEVGQRDEPVDDEFLFNQGPTRGLGKIRFHDYRKTYASVSLPNVDVFKKQIRYLKTLLAVARPDKQQAKDIDFLLNLGELFTLVVYGQLIIENAAIYGIDDEVLDQIFDVMVRDFSRYALQLYGKPETTRRQQMLLRRMIRRPAVDQARFNHVWEKHVFPLHGTYQMNEEPRGPGEVPLAATAKG
ncbi:MAG: acyl-CoA dehydrogenase [Gammaproteobacteria bacterium]|nr:acyl-CoA dehydrogenase [Gammaproteobacteria bacterium]NNF60639.1 acyl-CoA dehydrogenase [Gammaproteobacteria bacterium]NNM20717.1 acyl-CoA dehydrogenase [Gammaproteobacteria bacterium]